MTKEVIAAIALMDAVQPMADAGLARTGEPEKENPGPTRKRYLKSASSNTRKG